MIRPRVSADQRHLAFPDGQPFFWLADTAWELFHRLDREETVHYLRARASQGFNVIQAVGLAEFDGLHQPNRFGDRPLIDDDPTKLNEGYWKHVDWVLEQAAALGLYVGLLPTWGDKVSKAWGIGPVIFNETNAHVYGRLIGRRYAQADNVIWINGGDREPGDAINTWRALAKGLREGDDSHERLMTFHPQGGRSSGLDFQNDDWLDFNMLQTSHGKPNLDYVAGLIRDSYQRTPTKPVLDGEPNYENHPIDFNKTQGYFDDGHVRQSSYTSVFSGGCGITYGCHAVWQFAQDRFEPVNNPISHWKYSLGLPGACQIRHLKDLMLSLPFLKLEPADLVEAPSQARCLSTPSRDVVVIYLPSGDSLRMRNAIVGKPVWLNPENGERMVAESADARTFAPPRRQTRVNDWVLIAK